jgi:hypothetical protein
MKFLLWIKLCCFLLGLTLAGCLDSPVEGQGLVPTEAGCASSDECDASAGGAGLICVAGQCTSCRNDSNCKPYGDGAICWDRRCQAVESCADDVCDTPPTGTCDGKTAIRYSAVGQCAQGECAYDSDERQCANDESCVNGECFSDALCDDVVCDTPPAPGCDEIKTNDVISYGSQGSCQPGGSCTYPETRSSCADGDVCTNGVCYAAGDACAGFQCDAPSAGTCSEQNGQVTATSYRGVCDSSTGVALCDNSPTETTCTINEVCLEGACLDWCHEDVKICDTPPANTCVDNGGVATNYAPIGTCNPGSGQCEYTRTADGYSEVFCADNYKECSDGAATASCGGCLQGSTPVGGECEPPECGDNEFASTLGGNVGCLPCDCTGDKVMTSAACKENPNHRGQPLCEPKAGYFVVREDAAAGATDPNAYIENCDSDMDGWVTAEADTIANLISKPDRMAEENLLVEYFKCNVRVVNMVKLINDRCEELVLELSREVKLWENRSLDKLNQTGTSEREHNPEGFEATHLNPLTKGCSTDKADYNNNDTIDIAEAATAIQAVNGGYTISNDEGFFDNFSYFMELYDGYYVGDNNNVRSCSSPADPACGTYVIKEKPRAGSLGCDATAQNQVPIKYHADAYMEGNDYWQRCERRDDSTFTAGMSKAGHDFAGLVRNPSASFSGLFHHSQYKCVQINNGAKESLETVPGAAPEVKLDDLYADPGSSAISPEVIRAANKKAYQWNKCTKGAERARMGNATNSTLPGFDCTADNPGSGLVSAPADAAVGWVAVRYIDYGIREQSDPSSQYIVGPDYIRGCVNECEDAYTPPASCFNESFPRQGGRCSGDVHNFGELLCGCGTNYGGPGCQVGCPADYVRISDDFNLANRKNTNVSEPAPNIWMCMRPVSSYGALEATGAAGESITLRGRVPISATNRQELSSQDLSSGDDCKSPDAPMPCYTLR